jgi:hypothetical protein
VAYDPVSSGKKRSPKSKFKRNSNSSSPQEV